MKRFTFVLAAVGLVAAIATGTAGALRFTDDDYIWEAGEVGTPYFKQLNAAAGCPPYKFRILSGALPDGLTLSGDGKVTGTPQRLGEWSFWLELRGAGCPIDAPAERQFSMAVIRIKLTVQDRLLPDAIRGAAYPTQTLQAVGGTSTGYSWSLSSGSLPAGLTLNANGTITGTPTTNGVSIFTVLVKDSAGRTDTKQLSIAVVDPLTVSASRRVAEIGVPFTATVKPSGGTPGYTVTAAGLPSGLTFDPERGVITGSPAAAGAFPLQVSIRDAHGLTTTGTINLTVVAHIAIAAKRLPSAVAGAAYSARLRLAGGARPFKWAARGLPRGIRLRARTGVLAGVASTAGTYQVRLQVRDALGAIATRVVTLSVR